MYRKISTKVIIKLVESRCILLGNGEATRATKIGGYHTRLCGFFFINSVSRSKKIFPVVKNGCHRGRNNNFSLDSYSSFLLANKAVFFVGAATITIALGHSLQVPGSKRWGWRELSTLSGGVGISTGTRTKIPRERKDYWQRIHLRLRATVLT